MYVISVVWASLITLNIVGGSDFILLTIKAPDNSTFSLKHPCFLILDYFDKTEKAPREAMPCSTKLLE